MNIERYRNQKRLERYYNRIAPLIAAAPLAHLERVAKGIRLRMREDFYNDPPEFDQFDGHYDDLSRGF